VRWQEAREQGLTGLEIEGSVGMTQAPSRSYYESNWLSKRWRSNLAKMIRALLPENWDTLELLDVGVGDGYTLRLVKPTGEVSGIDFDEGILKEARNRGIRATYGSAYEIPTADASFDAVMCVEVLEHLDRPEAGLKEVTRVLRPGGYLIATTPVPSFRWRLIWWFWTKMGPGKRWNAIPHVSELHLGNKSSEDGGLTAMLRESGFEVLATERCNFGMVAGVVARKHKVARLG